MLVIDSNIKWLITQKLEERKATLMKLNFKETKAWVEAMTTDIMSSEESGHDDDENIIVVRPLHWRF